MTPLVSPLDGTLFGPAGQCFGCSPTHPAGFRLRFEPTDEGVRAVVTPQAHHQGPLGLVHGGLITTLADEAAAWAVLAATGKFGFTTHVEGRMAKGIRIGEEVELTGKVIRPGHRVVRAEAVLRQGGETCFTGGFTFVLVDRAGAEKLMGAPLLPEWERFCR